MAARKSNALGSRAKEAAAGTQRGAPGATQRTFFRLIALDAYLQQRFSSDWQIQRPAAAVDQGAGSHNVAALLLDNADGLARRASRRPNVFDHENAFPRPKLEAATQRHAPGRAALHEDRAHPERSRHFMTQHHASQRRRRYAVHPQIVKLGGQGASQFLSVFGELQHQRALDVRIAVAAARKLEVAFADGAYIFQRSEDLVRSHRFLPRPVHPIRAGCNGRKIGRDGTNVNQVPVMRRPCETDVTRASLQP